jgi:hypothetical protein
MQSNSLCMNVRLLSRILEQIYLNKITKRYLDFLFANNIYPKSNGLDVSFNSSGSRYSTKESDEIMGG